MPSMPSRHSLFRFSCPHGGPCWTMVSRFSQDGQVVRYKIGNDGSEIEIGEQYFAHEWFYDRPSLQWRMCLRSPTHNSFRQSLHDLLFTTLTGSNTASFKHSTEAARKLGATADASVAETLATKRIGFASKLLWRSGDIMDFLSFAVWNHAHHSNELGISSSVCWV